MEKEEGKNGRERRGEGIEGERERRRMERRKKEVVARSKNTEEQVPQTHS
jgi:hypothetical protein